jgi:pimeloyl-ACP methyl ester carboxylesterase
VSATHLENRLVHYEVIGRRGQPIIFLHSWLGSWRYWLPTMDSISDRHRSYAIDFWGFGESDRHESLFSISEYVTMLRDFMDKIGLARASVVGHGLGGMVAIRAAAEYPDRFLRIAAVATPGQGSSLQQSMKSGGLSRIFGRGLSDVWTRQLRQLNVDYPQVMQEIIQDTEQISEGVVRRVMDSIIESDVRQDLGRLTMPLLAVNGQRDTIVTNDISRYLSDPDRQEIFQQAISLPKSNHFPFLDQPNVFNRMLVDYLNLPLDGPIQLKTEWRRRVNQLEYI